MIHEDDNMMQPGQESVAEGEMNRPAEVTPEQPPAPRKKARRGFAAMSPEKQKEIASLGGKAAHAKGTAHEFSPEEAREARRRMPMTLLPKIQKKRQILSTQKAFYFAVEGHKWDIN